MFKWWNKYENKTKKCTWYFRWYFQSFHSQIEVNKIKIYYYFKEILQDNRYMKEQEVIHNSIEIRPKVVCTKQEDELIHEISKLKVKEQRLTKYYDLKSIFYCFSILFKYYLHICY